MISADPPEIPTRNSHTLDDATSVAIATILGAYIGTWIDNNTRFGTWINNSHIANIIFAIIKLAAIIFTIWLLILYLYFFMSS